MQKWKALRCLPEIVVLLGWLKFAEANRNDCKLADPEGWCIA